VLVEEGIEVFGRLEMELTAHLTQKGYRTPADCRGKLKEL
jgi:dihydroorotate dehydrogenase (fumarate)